MKPRRSKVERSTPQAKPKAETPQVELPAKPAPKPRLGTVTLWGEILEDTPTHLKMAIKNHADAIDVGICGTHWIAKRQLYGDPKRAEGFDFVRVSFVYASCLAHSSQQCE